MVESRGTPRLGDLNLTVVNFLRPLNSNRIIFNRFTEADLSQLCTVLTNTVAIPVHNNSTPYIMTTITDNMLTPLYEANLNCIEFLQKEVLADVAHFEPMITILLKQLMLFSKYACAPPVIR